MTDEKLTNNGNTRQAPGRAVGAFLLALIAVSLVPTFVGSATATTSPGVSILIHGLLTNSRVTLVHSSRGGGAYVGSDGSTATFGRGTTVIFRFKNEGTQPLLPAIKVIPGPYMPPITSPSDRNKVYTLAAPKVAKPGGSGELIVTFIYRGAYRLLELSHKQAHGAPVKITVN